MTKTYRLNETSEDIVNLFQSKQAHFLRITVCR